MSDQREAFALSADEVVDRPTPLARHQVIEADQFCPCGYNLHSQVIERDDRLGFNIVRCPECGRFHPAGHGSTATRPWLARLAVVLLFVWGMLLLGAGFLIGLALFGLNVGHLEEFTTGVQVHPQSGRPLQEDWNVLDESGSPTRIYLDTGEPAPPPPGAVTSYGYYRQTRMPFDALPPHAPNRLRAPSWRTTAAFVGFIALGAFVVGTLQSGALWHLNRLAMFIPPLLVIGGSAAVWLTVVYLGDPGYFQYAYPIAWRGLLVVNSSALLGWTLGLFIGRPIFRGLVRLLIPPRPRQVLAFLWHADGKAMPAATPKVVPA